MIQSYFKLFNNSNLALQLNCWHFNMANIEPAAKRAKRDKFAFDSSSDDDDSVIKNMEMDTENAWSVNSIYTSDDSDNDWSSVQSNHKPMVLKVPRGKATVPECVKNPNSALVSDSCKVDISEEQFKALSIMSLEHICIFAETSKAIKEIALKFFPMKYRNMNLVQLINPATGKYQFLWSNDIPSVIPTGLIRDYFKKKLGKYSLDSVRRMLRIFGHLIWSLDLNLGLLDDQKDCVDLLDLVRNHCVQTLGWLTI